MPKLVGDEFQILARYVRDLTGISLDSSKSYLIETRFQPLLQEYGCASFSELYNKSRNDATRVLPRRLIDAITTGETLFFRDSAPFDLLRHKLLPELIDRKTRLTPPGRPIPLRIWSAACSTGQEVYSIGIILKELLGNLDRYTIRLLGTDISDQAVAAASRGIYNRIEIERGLPRETLLTHFTASGESWKIRDEVRALATFRQFNLLGDLGVLGSFDIVFCRNVAIYFAEQDKASLFSRIAGQLDPEGVLIIGSTETLNGVCPLFEAQRHLRSVFYRLAPRK